MPKLIRFGATAATARLKPLLTSLVGNTFGTLTGYAIGDVAGAIVANALGGWFTGLVDELVQVVEKGQHLDLWERVQDALFRIDWYYG